MEEELPVAVGIVRVERRLLVRRDVCPDEPGLPFPDVAVGTVERRAAVPEGLDLRAAQHDAGLDPVEQLVVVPRPPVVHDHFRPAHVSESRVKT